MARKRYTTEQIIAKLREAEVALAQGDSVATVVRQLGVAEQTSTRGRREDGGLQGDQAKRLKELEQENQRLRRVVADQALDNAILQEVASGNFYARRTDVRQSATCRLPSMSRSVGRVASCAKPGARNAIRPARPRMSPPWWRAASPWRRASDVTAPVAARRCCGPKAGACTTNGSSGAGAARACACPRSRRGAGACGWRTARPHGAGPPARIMSGPTTSGRTAPTTDDRGACSASSTSTPARASRSSSPVACAPTMSWPVSRSSSWRTAHAVRSWLPRVGVTTLFIQPGSPWENGSGESFNGKLRDECLNGEIFTTLAEAKALIARWRREYNEQRPHSALGSRPPAPPTIEARPAVRLQELQPMTALT